MIRTMDWVASRMVAFVMLVGVPLAGFMLAITASTPVERNVRWGMFLAVVICEACILAIGEKRNRNVQLLKPTLRVRGKMTHLGNAVLATVVSLITATVVCTFWSAAGWIGHTFGYGPKGFAVMGTATAFCYGGVVYVCSRFGLLRKLWELTR